MPVNEIAPEWECSKWLNSDGPLSLADFRGRPIVAAAFQMLCPGCVARTIPQLNEARQLFGSDDLAVLGLHSVFEHHEAMREPSLRAFLHEYQVQFPVGIDRYADNEAIPVTMQRYGLRGTPTLMLIDAQGVLRRMTFGHIPDMQLGAEIMALLREGRSNATDVSPASEGAGRCEIGSGAC